MGEHKFNRTVSALIKQRFDEEGNCIGQDFTLFGEEVWSAIVNSQTFNYIGKPAIIEDFPIELVPPPAVQATGKIGRIHYTQPAWGGNSAFDIDIDYGVDE